MSRRHSEPTYRKPIYDNSSYDDEDVASPGQIIGWIAIGMVIFGHLALIGLGWLVFRYAPFLVILSVFLVFSMLVSVWILLISTSNGEIVHGILCLFIPGYLLILAFVYSDRYLVPFLASAAVNVIFVGIMFVGLYNVGKRAATTAAANPPEVNVPVVGPQNPPPQPFNPPPRPIFPPVNPNPTRPIDNTRPVPPRREPVGGTGLVAHWTFDVVDGLGNIQDFSGRNNHGHTATPLGVPGVKVAALAFDWQKKIQPFNCGTSEDFNFQREWDFTITGWFSTQQPGGTILCFANPEERNGSRARICLRIQQNQLQAEINDDSAPRGVQPATINGGAIQLGKIYHFALVRSKGQAALYVDGQQVGTTQAPHVAGDITTRYRCLGGEPKEIHPGFNAAWSFKGAIDEVRIFHRALTPEQIQVLFANP